MDTEVRRYVDSPENRKTLFEFYERVYPGSPWLHDGARFVWQTLENPLLEPGATEIWLLYTENDEIIGQNIYIRYTLRIDGRSHYGYCSTNLIVEPGIVGKGFGHKLIQVNEERGGVAYAVGITPASTRAFVKRGWILHEEARLYTRFTRPMPNLKYVGMPSWKRLLGAPVLKMADTVAGASSRLRVPRSLDGVSHREIERFDSSHDDLWREYLSAYAIHFERQADMLNFKYASRPDVKHERLLFESNGKPVGYGVYRLSENRVKGIRLGRIVDLVYDPTFDGDLCAHTIGVMARRLLAMRVDGLVGVAATKKIAASFKKSGFWLSRPQAAIIKETDFKLPDLRQRYTDLWYITLGDSDLDNYW